MKNLIIYYFAAMLPLPLLILLSKNDNPVLFTVMLLFYILYRGVLDSKRLIRKDVIKKSDMWKMICIPFYSVYYFNELYFEV